MYTRKKTKPPSELFFKLSLYAFLFGYATVCMYMLLSIELKLKLWYLYETQ